MQKLKSYQTLLKEFNGSPIPYNELLTTIDWMLFREQVVERDRRQCTKCNKPVFRPPTEDEKREHSGFVPIQLGDDTTFMEKATLVAVNEHPEIVLHVHHTYYVWGKAPWEYKKDALITVCESCHSEIHKNENIPVYSDGKRLNILKLKSCTRCSGSGYLPQYHYYYDGVCFDCNGMGGTL